MKNKKLLSLVGSICLTLILVLIWVAVPFGTGCAPKVEEPIKIGAILCLTGVVAELGPKFQAGIELALEEANYEVAGRPIQLIVEDSATDVTTAVEKFKKLVDRDKVHVVIGPLMGDSHLAMAPYAAEKKVLVTSLINGMYETVQYETYLIYPTTCMAQTYPFGEYCHNVLGYNSMITIGANYAGKIAYANGAAKGFEDAGGTVVDQLWPDLGTPDYSPFIAAFGEADVVLYALEGPGPVSRFIYQYREAGKTMPLVTITQDGDYTPEALAELGDIALGIPGESSYPWQLDTAINKAFVKAIKAKTGVVPSCSEQNAYTMAKVVLAGLEATGGDDSFDKLWPAILALEIDTPQGPLSFTPEGVAITDMYVTQAEKVDGEYRLSAPIAVVHAIRDWRLPR